MPLFTVMALSFGLRKKVKEPAPAASKAPAADEDTEIEGNRGLPSLFDKGITLQGERLELLKKGLEDGLEFFNKFNDDRMHLAFEGFTEDMKHALYETLFFLHVNDPTYSEVKFTGIEVEHIYGITREHEYEATANLYLEGAPHGVQGIDDLPEMFREDFRNYIQSEFNTSPSSAQGGDFCPIVSISSLGSIGTVGHKPFKSDLDLQVQYELEPFEIETNEWDDERLIKALRAELSTWMNRIRIKRKIPSEKMKDPRIREELQKIARAQVKKSYNQLYKYLLVHDGDYRKDLKAKGASLRQALLHEMMSLIKRACQRERSESMKKQEELLKKRVDIVQDYIQKKFPKAEIYLFLAFNPEFRKGNHGTTLQSKEASGSAYELILSYEVLMPGIQFLPTIPAHFAFPKIINDSHAFYDRTIDYIRFGAVSIYKDHADKLVDLGATPALPMKYVLAHGGMVYWESFKAASGNLAKALLNLFRIEMIHEKKYLIMIIELIKNPSILDKFIAKPTEEELSGKGTKDFGLRPFELLQMEKTRPALLQDPWWTKYKVLKIAFGELPYLELEERKRISKVIDLCFGLHVKVSEVFTKPGDTRKFDSHREQFLLDFLNRAFPNGSPQRKFLEHVNIGETKAVIQFENELKDLFKSSLDRVLDIQSKHAIPDESNQKEFEIWYHYYQKNFEPPKNMVRRSILHHLKVPRLRLQTGYYNDKKMWMMRSMQTESKLGKRFDTFGVLDHLPDEVDLTSARSFTYILADCVLNSYYGYVDQGSLKEKKSIIEFDSKHTFKGEIIDGKYAYVRPDNVARIADRITEFFVYRTYHYLDCINVPKHYLEIFFFLNLKKFGQLSVLYRDNLTNWYLDEFNHPDLRKQAHNLYVNYKDTFKSKLLYKTLKLFIKDRQIELANPKVKTQFWFNPNSAQTNHAANKVVEKENDLGEEFKKFVYKAGQ